MTSNVPDDDDIDAQITRLIAARQGLERAAALVRREAVDAHRLDICGTDELPTALSALAADHVDSEEDAARWVSRAFTALPAELLLAGGTDSEVGLCGAVFTLRSALAELDAAVMSGQPE